MWRLFRPFLFFCAALVFPNVAAATLFKNDPSSEFVVRFWRPEDGLTPKSVTAITQTSDGYLWIGSRNGLVRFDGFRFVTFSSNPVLALAAGANNSLWMAAEEGLTVFRNSVFEPIPLLAPFGRINRLLAMSDDSVWIASNDGLFVLRANRKFERIAALSQISVRALASDASGVVWIGAANGLWKSENGQLTAVAPLGASVTALSTAPDGVIWIGGDSIGLLQRSAGNGAPRRVWSVSALSEILRSATGDIWLTKRGGQLERLSLESSAATPIALGVEKINCLFEDRENNLWIGTEEAGLAQVRRRTVRLYESKAILSVAEDTKGVFWAVSESGGILSLNRGRVEPVKFASDTPEVFFETICPSRAGGLWMGTRFDGLFHWSGLRNQKPEKRAASVGISALFEDRQERLWIASGREGVMLLDHGLTRIIRSPDGDSFGDVSGFAQDNEGRVWIATRRRGIAEWNGGAARWLPNQDALREGRIQTLYADVEGNLWIGSNRGLTLSRNGRIASATTQQGLYDEMIYQIVEDFRGNLWLGANRGLFRVARSELEDLFAGKTANVHSVPGGLDEGLAGLEGIGGGQPTALKAQDGKLWFATRRGLAVVDPVKDPAPSTLPVVIEEVRADNRPVARNSGAVIIPPGHQQLQLRFTALTFTAPERTQFRYQLEGVDRDWNRADSNRVAVYPRLAAGEYLFRVMARNDSASWSEGPPLLMRVPPNYWETGWFKAIIAGTVLAIFGFFWIDRIARQRQWDALRQQITRDLHDDLGSNIGSLALLSEALQNPSRPREAANELLKEINQISRQTLDAMRDAVWFVDPEKDSTTDVIARLKLITESMLKGVDHHLEVNEAAGARKMPLLLKRGIVLVFKETLHNLIRHSHATRAEIHITLDEGLFEFEVSDNGQGFDLQASGGGHGLKNLRHRARKLGGTLHIKSVPGQGTRVHFRVNIP